MMLRHILLGTAFLIATNLFSQPGVVDITFGQNGKTTVAPQPVLNKAYGLLQMPDGNIIVAGYALYPTGNAMCLARLLPDGTLDNAFGTAGFVKISIGDASTGYAAALQPDGKILVAGGASPSPGGATDFAIARYLANGTPDISFSGDGLQTISFSSGDDLARAIAVQADGKILVAGTSTNGSGSAMALARLKVDGSLDPTFSADGKVTLPIGTIFTNGYALAVQTDGKILLTGAAKFGMADDVALARFLPSGSLDLEFNATGYLTTNLGSDADSGNALAVQPDGKIVVAGISGETRDFTVLRYLTNGTLDPDFGNQGKVITDFFGSDDYANSVHIQTDGKIVVGGYAYNGTSPDYALARYAPNGAPDAGFGSDGRVSLDFNSSYDYGFPLTFQSDGKILLGGYSYSDGQTSLAVARFISGLNVGLIEPESLGNLLVSPNPIQHSAVFSFELTAAAQYSLSLYDGQGKMVKSFFQDQSIQQGAHDMTLFFPENMPSGWYFLRLYNRANTLTVKILKD